MRDKVRFFTKCIAAAFPFILVIGYTFAGPMGYMDSEYPKRAYIHEVIKGSEDYETLILGDSRAMADLMSTEISGSCVNLAAGGATAIESYCYLDEYLKHHAAPKRCVILFAPFHYSYMDNWWSRTVYFNDLSVRETAEVLRDGKTCGSETVSEGDFSKLFSNRMRLPNVYLPALLNARFAGRLGENKAALAALRETKGYAPFGTAEESAELNYETTYESLRESGDADLIRLYMRKILDRLQEEGVQAVILQAPMNEASYGRLQEGFVQGYTMLMRSFADLYPDVYVETQIPCYGNDQFGDSSHLNERGAERFTGEAVALLSDPE